eukprot:INCI635.1.p1 GENE.INCI635.1~~INCI635.1.p1  ORF type:complete len:1186 (-),score=153.54 INCI635.1:187-3744(-)
MLRPSISDTRRSSAIAMPRAMTEHLQFSPDSAGVADDKGATTAAQRKRKRRRQYERATVLEWGFTPCGQITVVFVAWVLLIILGSLLYSAALSADGTEVIVNGTFGRAVWWAYILFIDSGTQTSLSPDDHNPWILVVAVVQSMSGILFLLIILAIVVDRVRDMCHRYRELHFRILQKDHVLILGWNDKTLFLIRELCSMYDSTRQELSGGLRCCSRTATAVRMSDGRKVRPVIIVLSTMTEESRVQQLRTAFSIESRGFRMFLQGVEIIFATGVSTEPDALRRVSLHSARFVMIVSDSAERSNVADQKTLRTVLAVQATITARRLQVAPQRRLSMFGLGGHHLRPAAATEDDVSVLTPTNPNNKRRLDPTFRGTLIAEIRVQESGNVFRTIGRGMDLRVVSMRTTINATYALHALVPTLGQFFSEIMRYDGNELYCSAVLSRVLSGALVGLTFDEARSRLDGAAVVIGVVKASKSGNPVTIVLAPKQATSKKEVLSANDKLVFLAGELNDLQLGDMPTARPPGSAAKVDEIAMTVRESGESGIANNSDSGGGSSLASVDGEKTSLESIPEEKSTEGIEPKSVRIPRSSSLSIETATRYTSELLIRQRSFLMIGYPTDMGDYLDTFNRFLRLRTGSWRHRGDSTAFNLWMDVVGRTEARQQGPESEVYSTCQTMWGNFTESERAVWHEQAKDIDDSLQTNDGGAGAGGPGTPRFEVPLRDSEAHHIYVLANKTAEWRYQRALSFGRPWKVVRFYPFDSSCQDGEWLPDVASNVDETLRRGGTITSRFGDLLVHHMQGDSDSASEIEEAILFVSETNEFGAGKLLDAVLILADCDDINSLVSDSSALTSLLHVRTLAKTLVTIRIQIPEGKPDSLAQRRNVLQDLVEHLNSRGSGFNSSTIRYTVDSSGNFRFIRTALSAEACAELRKGHFAEYISDISLVLQHWMEGGNQIARVITEVLDIDTDRILRNNPLLRSKSVFFPSNLLETGMFAFNAQSEEVNAVLHALLGNILFNADLSQTIRSQPGKQAHRTSRPAVYPIAFELISNEFFNGHDVCSFDELSRQLRRQDAVLLGWNRRADEVVDFGDSSFEAVARTSSSSSEKDIGSQSSVSANVNPTKGAADAAHGDANLLRRRKPRTHKGPQPKRRLCINPIEKSERVYFRPDDELIILLRPNEGTRQNANQWLH